MYGQHTRLENEILNKILSYHFFVESYTFFCIFCQARPRVSGCVFHAIPTQRHATVTVGPGDEAVFLAIEIPGGKRNLNMNINAQQVINIHYDFFQGGECLFLAHWLSKGYA